MDIRDDKKRCLECGGDLKPGVRTGIMTCIYCGREYPKEVAGFEDALQEIANQRQLREFIKAEELCEELLKEQPESCEAHWQALLASLGVLYVQEEGKAKPTFFSCSYNERESIFDDEHYRDAVRFAPDEEAKNYYRVKARELDVLLKEFFELVKKEANYDIFISFKQTVEVTVNGTVRKIETDDCRKAHEIYNHLKDRYHVFFSPVSIGKDTGIQGEKYEPRILKALQSSQAMILIGFTEENLKAQWVENEWKRYKYYIDKGKKKKDSLIVVYEKVMPRLPSALKDVEWPNYDVYDVKYLDKLEKKLEFVNSKKGLKSSISKKNLSASFEDSGENLGYSNLQRLVISEDAGRKSIKINPTEEQDLATAEGILNHRRWGDAAKKYRQIIKTSPDCYRAYWGEFKAKIKAESDIEVSANIINATEEEIQLLHEAIACSSDEKFSWKIVDSAMECFSHGYEWKKVKPIYEFLIKYIDVKRIEKMHDILEKMCARYVSQGNVKISEEVFESARKIFIEEVKERSIKFMKAYAISLRKEGFYVLARRYFEQLASVKSTANNYLNLLACRLSTSSITETKIKLVVDPTDDSSQKKPSELDLDEIIERIVICDCRERSAKITPSTYKLILPYYRVIPAVGTTPADLAIEIREAAGLSSLTEAYEFIESNGITANHRTKESAQKAADVLAGLGISILDIRNIAAGTYGYVGASAEQLFSEIRTAQNMNNDDVKTFIAKNNIKPEYSEKAECEAAAKCLEGIGIEGVVVYEDNPNAEANAKLRTQTYGTMCKILLYQVKNNKRHVHTLMETIVSCYRQLGEKELLREVMLMVAEAFVEEKNFKQANIWYNELIIEDSNDAVAHWGTLKCRLKAIDDYSVSKHSNKLMSLQEFNNAINCADNEQNKYYMSVYYREVPKPEKKKKNPRERLDLKAVGKKIGAFIKRLVNYLICAVAVMAGYLMIYDPAVYFKKFHFTLVLLVGGGVIAIAFIVALTRYYSVRNSTSESTYKQNSKARHISCQTTMLFVALLTMGLGMLMAKDRTYKLSTVEDFNLMCNIPFAGQADYVLENDVDFGGKDCPAYGAIGEFSGRFNGQGHAIKGIYISDGEFVIQESKLSEYSFGFVKTVTKTGVIENLNFIDCFIIVSDSEYRDTNTGIITGVNGGLISGCNVTDSYLFVKSLNESSTAYVGGIAGVQYSSASNTHSSSGGAFAATYGKGVIDGCTFYTANDEGDDYDDDNYSYAIVTYNVGKYEVNGIAYGYNADDTSVMASYAVFESYVSDRSNMFTKTYKDIFGTIGRK